MPLGCAVLLTQSAPLTGTATYTVEQFREDYPQDAIRTPHGDGNSCRGHKKSRHNTDAIRTPHGDGNSMYRV